MADIKKKKDIPTVFAEIETSQELRQYLDDSINRLRSSKFIHHYTTLNNVVKMLCGGSWHLGSSDWY